MQDLIKHFQRDAFGAWLCIEPATLDLPTGRIQITPADRAHQAANARASKLPA